MIQGSSLFSPNPGKRAAERWYLLYTPIWGAAAGLVMTTGLGVRWSQQAYGDFAFLLLGVCLWLGVLVGGYLFRAPEDAARPWWKLYHTKFQLWMFVFAFLGNYFTEYFYEVLHLHYGFETRWNLNHVPLFLYFLTVAYFSTYGTLINVFRRLVSSWLPARAPAWLRAGAFLPACFAVAGLETLLNANPWMKSLFCYDDPGLVLGFGTFVYGLWFVVTAPLWFSIDEGRGVETPLRQVWLTALAGFMLVIVVNEGIRSFVAPHFTTVERGAIGLDNFGSSCLAPKPVAVAALNRALGSADAQPGGEGVEILGQIGGGAFTVVCFVVGIRLLGLAARTRQLPELLIGASMLMLAGLGYPLSAVAREAHELSPAARSGLGLLAGLLAAVGLTANSAFTFVLFRRRERWAQAFLVCTGLFCAGLFLAQSLSGDWTHGTLFWGWLPFGVTLSYGWCFLECGRYHRLLRRRMRIGLADPIVTDRFGLYAAATGLAVVTNCIGQIYWWSRVEMLTDEVGALLLLLLGSGSTVLMCLAFLPPRAYLERVRARSTAEA